MEEAIKEALQNQSEPPKSSKRQLESAGSFPDTKKPDNTTRPEFERSISDQLKEIRMSCGNENISYIPNQTQTNTTAKHVPASECSYAGTWDKGVTDIINIQILTVNGEDFKGSFKRPEALYVWKNVLGKEEEIIHGISFKMIPRKPLQIVMRLKAKVNIDDYFQRDDFSYNRGEKKADGSFDIICGRILGLRKPKNTNSNPDRQTFTRVNLYGCEFDLTRDQIFAWMAKFGDIHSEPHDIMDRECPNIATGDMSIVMKLEKQIPSFLPMYGKKIRVAYRGMVPVCSNCFDVNHMRVECGNTRANYLDYVNMLIERNRFEPSLFGSWVPRVKKYLDYKKNQRSTRPKPPRNEFEEQSYCETEDKEGNDDKESTTSYKSTETVIDLEDETAQTTETQKTSPNTQPTSKGIFGGMMAKLTSFDSKNTSPKQ